MGADLVFAKLQGAKLSSAKLQGANLEGAQLQGAHLEDAQLQGASLDANMQGAWLKGTSLQGAWLKGTSLQGALLENVNLTAASLNEVGLEGAWIQGGYLMGASFHSARLQGSKFLTPPPYLEGAMFDGICAWRADARKLPPERARVVEPIVELQSQGLCHWGANSLTALERVFNEQLPEGKEREDALARIAILDPITPLDGEEAMAKAWADLARSSPTPDIHEKTLAEWLQKTGCDADGASYVIRGLLRNLDERFGSGSSRSSTIAAAFLDETQCKGARELAEDDKAKLREIRDRHPSATPRGPAR
jgi:hypothetical protein